MRSISLFKKIFPNLLLGLSDHTFGHTTILGAIALGAKVFEKHYTLKNNLRGPDHKFAMNPKSWSEMIHAARELESSLGLERKIVEKNELNSIIVQRRAVRANKNLKRGHIISKKDLICLRPCPKVAVSPFDINKILNKKLKKNKIKGDFFRLSDFKYV